MDITSIKHFLAQHDPEHMGLGDWEACNMAADIMEHLVHCEAGQKPTGQGAAAELLRDIHNADGSTGPHWSRDAVAEIARRHSIPVDVDQMWIAMSMLRAACWPAAESMRLDNDTFWAKMAESWLQYEDKDRLRVWM